MRRVLLALVLAGCVAGSPSPSSRRSLPTLLVRNDLAVPVAVYVEAVRVGTADAMRSTCIVVRFSYPGEVQIYLKPLAERGYPVQFPVVLDTQPGWRLDVGQSQIASSISLRPAPRCR